MTWAEKAAGAAAAIRPDRAIWHEEAHAVEIVWSNGAWGRYHVRGGISWPVAVQETDGLHSRVVGWAIAVGVDIKTGACRVIAHTEFSGIEPTPHRKVVPLVPWLLRTYAECYCFRYYWHQPRETTRQYRTLLHRCPQMVPPVRCSEVPWADDNAAWQSVWIAAAEERLTLPSSLYDAIDKHKQHDHNAPLHALTCAMMGMQRWPYRERRFGEG